MLFIPVSNSIIENKKVFDLPLAEKERIITERKLNSKFIHIHPAHATPYLGVMLFFSVPTVMGVLISHQHLEFFTKRKNMFILMVAPQLGWFLYVC